MRFKNQKRIWAKFRNTIRASADRRAPPREPAFGTTKGSARKDSAYTLGDASFQGHIGKPIDKANGLLIQNLDPLKRWIGAPANGNNFRGRFLRGGPSQHRATPSASRALRAKKTFVEGKYYILGCQQAAIVELDILPQGKVERARIHALPRCGQSRQQGCITEPIRANQLFRIKPVNPKANIGLFARWFKCIGIRKPLNGDGQDGAIIRLRQRGCRKKARCQQGGTARDQHKSGSPI